MESLANITNNKKKKNEERSEEPAISYDIYAKSLAQATINLNFTISTTIKRKRLACQFLSSLVS